MSILEVSPVEKLTMIALSRKHRMIFRSDSFQAHQDSEACLSPCDSNSEDAKLVESYVKVRAATFETLHILTLHIADVIFRFPAADRRYTGPEK